MTKTSPKVDAYLGRAKRWADEMQALRALLLGCGLDEDLKWGKPCYGANGGNIAIMQPFKDKLALLFFKGVLLDDRHGLLRSQGENTQSALRLEFTSVAQIKAEEPAIRDYVAQAIAIEKSGARVDFKAKKALVYPDELINALDADPEFAAAFEALTPGRKRGYVLHFSSARQAATRAARIAKCRDKIFQGKGFNDR